jgi:membrane protein involved in colicin uptake
MATDDEAKAKAAAEQAAKEADAKAAAVNAKQEQEAADKAAADKAAADERDAEAQRLRDRVAELEAELAATNAPPPAPKNPNGTITANHKNEVVED